MSKRQRVICQRIKLTILNNDLTDIPSVPTTGYPYTDNGSYKKGNIQYINGTVTASSATSQYLEILNTPNTPKNSKMCPCMVGRANDIYPTILRVNANTNKIELWITPEITAFNSVAVYVDLMYEIIT